MTNKADRLKLDQYLRLNTLHYNLPSSCIILCIVVNIIQVKTLVTIIVYPDFMWHYWHQNVSQWHRPGPISLWQPPRSPWCVAGGDHGGGPRLIIRCVQSPQVTFAHMSWTLFQFRIGGQSITYWVWASPNHKRLILGGPSFHSF